MKAIEQSYEILDTNGMERVIERAARVCYKSEGRISNEVNKEFIRSLCNRGHLSVFEHGVITVLLVTDRGISHELVRHRIASYSQESTRYCNYSKDQFNKELTFIRPRYYKIEDRRTCEYFIWCQAMSNVEKVYFQLLEQGSTPQEARAVLPNSLKTEIIITANVREWRHIFELRCSKEAHPQMQELMGMVHDEFMTLWPELFDV
jgi:thymidylate synthase (FAD)